MDKNAAQRERRRQNGNSDTLKYERTNPRGFLMRVYRNMWARVMGMQPQKAHLYKGLAILPKQVFYAWALADESEFWDLWHPWQAAGRPLISAPSIDRINSDEGYTLDNMRWLTHSENSALGNFQRFHGAE